MKTARRRGISELVATMAMVAVTLSFGAFVANAALNQYSIGQNTASLSVVVQSHAAGLLITLAYPSVTASGSCPVYGGTNEGTLNLALYNYGRFSFTPAEVFVNGTLYAGSGTISAGALGTFAFTAPACVHATGQTVLLVDAYGDEVQLGT